MNILLDAIGCKQIEILALKIGNLRDLSKRYSAFPIQSASQGDQIALINEKSSLQMIPS